MHDWNLKKSLPLSLALFVGASTAAHAEASATSHDPHMDHSMHAAPQRDQSAAPADTMDHSQHMKQPMDPHMDHSTMQHGAPSQASATGSTDHSQMDHSNMGHSKMDHSKMGHGTPAVTEGPWSYKGRDNPVPHKTGRWEMVPVPGYGHMFVSTEKLSREQRCAALNNPGVMVDRATRAACGAPARKTEAPAAPAPAAGDHTGHH